METKRMENDELEINLVELFWAVMRKLPIVILAAVICAMTIMLYDTVLVTPQYQSTTKIYVLAQQNESALTSSDMQISNYLTSDYVELVKTRDVTESVIAELGLMSGKKIMTHEELLEKMTVSEVSDTRIITISVTDEDPYQACEIVNALREHAALHIQKVMNTQAVNVAEEGNIPQEPVSPSTLRDGVIGGFVGAFIAIAVVVVMFLLDDTINTSEDIEKYLGLSTLGIIPLDENQQKNKKKSKKIRYRKSSSGKRR